MSTISDARRMYEDYKKELVYQGEVRANELLQSIKRNDQELYERVLELINPRPELNEALFPDRLYVAYGAPIPCCYDGDSPSYYGALVEEWDWIRRDALTKMKELNLTMEQLCEHLEQKIITQQSGVVEGVVEDALEQQCLEWRVNRL